jgi:hypothetical protein
MARHEFAKPDVEALLVQCHRRCCICHRFCGVKIEIDHIEGAAAEDSDRIENAIPLCFDCHAEVHHYNPEHPRGRRFHPSELRVHREQWLHLCRDNPAMFVEAQRSPEAGSLERLLSELEFNRHLAGNPRPGGNFELVQFRRAIADGTFVWLPQRLKAEIQAAYGAMVFANGLIEGYLSKSQSENAASGAITAAQLPIGNAIKLLGEAL